MQAKANNKFIYLLKGCLMALIITTVLILITTIVLRFTSLSESRVPLINNIIMIFSVVLGGIYSSGKIKDNGWLQGAITGLFYYIIIILLSLLIVRSLEVFNIYLLSKMLISIFIGSIGGIIGVNLI